MKKVWSTSIIVGIVSIFLISLVSASMLYNDIQLNPDMNYTMGQGKFSIRHSVLGSGKEMTDINLKLKDLPIDKNYKYQAWLYNNNSDFDNNSDFYLNLGELESNSKHNLVINQNFKRTNFNIFSYDSIFISREPVSDFDLHPSEIVLSTELPFKSDKIEMKVKLNGRNEIPIVRTSSKGKGSFWVDTENNTLYYDIYYFRLSSHEIGAHIHGFALQGEESDVIANLTLGEHKVGSWNYSEEDEEMILEGKTYVNIHSAKYPGGEIRGQIVIK